MSLIFTLQIVCFTLYILFFLLNFIFWSLFFFIKRRKSEDAANTFFSLISFFFLFTAIAYLLRFWFMFFLPTNFYDEIINRNLQTTRELAKYHASLTYIGYAFLSSACEYSIYKKKTRYVFSILIGISSIILIILPYELSLSFQIVPIVICSATIYLLIITYLYFAYKYTGYVRKRSLIIAAGLFVFLIGQLFNNYGFLQILPPEAQYVRYTVISPSMQIIGILLLYYGYRKPD